MEAVKEVVEERVLPLIQDVAGVWRMKGVCMEWQDLINSSRFVLSWQRQNVAVPLVLAVGFDQEIWRSSPFNCMDKFKESFDWVEMEIPPVWKEWGHLKASAGGLLCFQGLNITVVNPVTGKYRVLPRLDLILVESFYMVMSQDSSEYTLCCVTNGSCFGGKQPMNGSAVHVYNSRLGQWRSRSMPVGWLHLSEMGEFVGNTKLHLLFTQQQKNAGLFIVDLEDLSFEVKKIWPCDKLLYAACVGMLSRGTDLVCCTIHRPERFSARTAVWDMPGAHERAAVDGDCSALFLDHESVLLVQRESLSTALLNLKTGQMDAVSFDKGDMLTIVKFVPSLCSSP